MVGPEVVEAVAATFEATEGTGMPLAERMILAMEAGQTKGGDRRLGNLQSAAIKIADPNDPGRGGDHIALAIEVGEHAEPVGEMKRIYYTTGRRLGYRTFSRDRRRGRDRAEAHAARARLLAPVARRVPRRAAQRQLAEDAGAAQVESGRLRQGAGRGASRRRPATRASTRCSTTRRLRRSTSSAPTKSLNYQGNPPGLVDQRFVDALKAAYLEKRKSRSACA